MVIRYVLYHTDKYTDAHGSFILDYRISPIYVWANCVDPD